MRSPISPDRAPFATGKRHLLRQEQEEPHRGRVELRRAKASGLGPPGVTRGTPKGEVCARKSAAFWRGDVDQIGDVDSSVKLCFLVVPAHQAQMQSTIITSLS